MKNYSSRKENTEINTVILHYTALSFKDSYRILTESGKVSSHFLIDEEGVIHQLVPLDKKAWHAGISSWRGKSDINQNSIGIEIVNPGMELKFLQKGIQVINQCDFTDKQYFALSDLIQKIKSSFPKITDSNIIGHSDITAKMMRKVDPGITFDWRFLNKLGHGLYYELEQNCENKILYKFGTQNNKIKELKISFKNFGYEIDINDIFDNQLSNVIFAFQLHYDQHNTKFHKIINNTSWDLYYDKLLSNLMNNLS